jgi:hypothetical protein
MFIDIYIYWPLLGDNQDIVLEPSEINLPLPSTTKIISVLCGRAHTLITTDEEESKCDHQFRYKQLHNALASENALKRYEINQEKHWLRALMHAYD